MVASEPARASQALAACAGRPSLSQSKAARVALQQEYGRAAVMIGSGGSIPVVDQIRRTLGIDSLLMGFGLDDDQIHSPNEKFEQRCFHHGIRSHARLLAKFAGG